MYGTRGAEPSRVARLPLADDINGFQIHGGREMFAEQTVRLADEGQID
jgi:hypothetical protein